MPYEHHLKKLSKEQQAKKTRIERLQTPQLFDVIAPQQIKDKNILLVDDIYTTGTTMSHAKKALLEAGAQEVRGFTLIHG